MAYVAVTVGGAVGSLVRYLLSTWIQTLTGIPFPWGTLTVNVAGSFVIGVAMVLSVDRGVLSPEMRLLLTTGFCGGFTTFSTFSYETLGLLRSEQWGSAGTNIALNLALCLAATALGVLAGRAL
jgi:fluoride exporter